MFLINYNCPNCKKIIRKLSINKYIVRPKVWGIEKELKEEFGGLWSKSCGPIASAFPHAKIEMC